MSAADIVVLGVVLLFVGLAVRYLLKRRKKGGCIGCEAEGGCGCGCGEKSEE